MDLLPALEDLLRSLRPAIASFAPVAIAISIVVARIILRYLNISSSLESTHFFAFVLPVAINDIMIYIFEFYFLKYFDKIHIYHIYIKIEVYTIYICIYNRRYLTHS